MTRSTRNAPDAVEVLLDSLDQDDATYFAALARVLEEGQRAIRTGKAPPFIGSGEGPGDLGIRAEDYLREIFNDWRD